MFWYCVSLLFWVNFVILGTVYYGVWILIWWLNGLTLILSWFCFGDAGLLLGLVCLLVCFNSVVYFIICSFGCYFCYLFVWFVVLIMLLIVIVVLLLFNVLLRFVLWDWCCLVVVCYWCIVCRFLSLLLNCCLCCLSILGLLAVFWYWCLFVIVKLCCLFLVAFDYFVRYLFAMALDLWLVWVGLVGLCCFGLLCWWFGCLRLFCVCWVFAWFDLLGVDSVRLLWVYFVLFCFVRLVFVLDVVWLI